MEKVMNEDKPNKLRKYYRDGLMTAIYNFDNGYFTKGEAGNKNYYPEPRYGANMYRKEYHKDAPCP
jgi:hypothetical protein